MTSIVYIPNYQGRLGNHMFQFAWALAASIDLGYNLSVPGIACDKDATFGSMFPRTHEFGEFRNKISIFEPFVIVSENETVDWVVNSRIDPVKFKQLYNERSILGDGFFQNYNGFSHRKEEIKRYFTLDRDKESINALAVHLRLDDTPLNLDVR